MLYLHIGAETTGSSSIQRLLRKEAFAAATGVERLMTGTDWGQLTFVHALRPDSRRHAEVRATLSRMAERVNADPARTYVLTNEVLFRKGVAATLAESLGDKVSVPVKVICYLRRPDAYLEACYKQRVKNGRIRPGALDYLEAERGSVDFNGILAEYASRFGAENVIVRPYERQRFPQGNVIMDFLSQIGVDQLPDDIETTPEGNNSLSAICSELVGLIARTNRTMHQDTLHRLSSSDNAALRRSRDVYTLAQRQAIMAECAANLEQLRRTFLPGLDSMFDMTDLAEGAFDPYPSAEERLELTRAAAEETIAKLCNLGEAALRVATAPDDETARAQRAERRRRRAARQAALATVDEPKQSQPPVGRKAASPRIAAGQNAAAAPALARVTRKPTLNLHVGAPKTATSHLQSRLAATELDARAQWIPTRRLRELRTEARAGSLPRPLSGIASGFVVASDENSIGLIGAFARNYEDAGQRVRETVDLGDWGAVNLFLSVRDYASWLPSVYSEALRVKHLTRDTLDQAPPRWPDLLRSIHAAVPEATIHFWTQEDYRGAGDAILHALTGGHAVQLGDAAADVMRSSMPAAMVQHLEGMGPRARKDDRQAFLRANRQLAAASTSRPDPFRPLSDERIARLSALYTADVAELDGLAIRLPAEHASKPRASASPARRAVPEGRRTPQPRPSARDAEARAI